ncbi:MAG: SLC13 family permease [marine benthic group bacterium]|nr:SLC13 family permease [Gemmatimonadota bacterium]
MSLEAGFTILVVGVTVFFIARDTVSPEVVLGAALVVLTATGVIDVEAALAGFSNPAIATIAAMFVVAAGLRATGTLEVVSERLFRGVEKLTPALFRTTVATASMSAFVNNTPVVAMAMPAVTSWSRRHRISPSKILIPASYASLLGGVCTLIGTSTNLVSDGLLHSHDLAGLGFFELARLGIPAAVVGIAYLVFVAPRLLPDRVKVKDLDGDLRRYTAEFEIVEPSVLTGKTVEQAGLRRLPGLFLVRIERSTGTIAPVDPGVRLFPEDRLLFAGVLETIVDLRKFRGLEPVAEEKRQDPSSGVGLHEAVVSQGSPLIGTSVRDANFRGRYNAAVIAVHRHGERIDSRIGDIVLRPGDTLLLEAAPGFTRAFRDSRDFYLVSRVDESEPPRHERMIASVAVLAFVVLTASFRVFPIAVAALGGAILMVALRCLTPGEAKRSVDWSVLIMIGAALGIAQAMESSGAAGLIAEGIVSVASGFGPIGVLGGMLIASMILTELVSNTAAIALMLPIALAAAGQLGLDPRSFLIAATVAASYSFSTPIGYQTNLMVYGPGGYRFTDFTRVGIPLQLILILISLLLIPRIWPLTP